MFIAVFLHELGHSSLGWYTGAHASDNPQPGGIASEREAGEYVEEAFFGGVSYCEFELDSPKPTRLVEIGLSKDGIFYPLSESRLY
jgi:hypothetical protein